MKTTTIGRIGAIVTGAAMLGTAVASALAGAAEVPADLTTGFFMTNGTPNVQIVVGEKAQASDGAAAGQIAAVIGNMAFTTKSESKAGGTVTVEGGAAVCTVTGAVECQAGNAEGQVKLSWDAVGMIGDLEMKEMTCDIYDNGMSMEDLDGTKNNWADLSSDDGAYDGEYVEIYNPDSSVGTTMVGGCETTAGSDVSILKEGEFNNEICTICYDYCDIALNCADHYMSEFVEIYGELINVEYDCEEEGLVVTTTDQGAIVYNVFTDDILTEDVTDDDDPANLLGQSYLGKIILGQSEYYVEDLDDNSITLVCGAKGVATTGAAWEYIPPAEGSACDAEDSGDTYSIKLVGAQTVEEKGVVDVTLEVTRPDGTTEQVNSGISGTPVVGDLKIKLQKGTASENIITGDKSFQADLLVWYVPSEMKFEDDEEYDSTGVNVDELDDDDDEATIGSWILDFNGGEDITVADVVTIEAMDDPVLGLNAANDKALDDIGIDENEQGEDCYEDADASGQAALVLRFLQFSLEKLDSDESLAEDALLQLPFNDGKYLLSDLKFGYVGLHDEDFVPMSMQETTQVVVSIDEIDVWNESESEMQEWRKAVTLSFTDDEGDEQEVRIDEGPFDEGDVIMMADVDGNLDIIKIDDIDHISATDAWNVSYLMWENGDWQDDDDAPDDVELTSIAAATLNVTSQVTDTEVDVEYLADGAGWPLDDSDWYIDNATEDDTDDADDPQLYIDANNNTVIELVTSFDALETVLDVIQISADNATSSVTVGGDDDSGGEDDVIIYLKEDSNVTITRLGVACDVDCDAADATEDGALISLSGAIVEILSESVEEPEDASDEDVIAEVTITLPENEMMPTIFFGKEETQNESSITITEAQEGTEVVIAGIDVMVDDFGVSVTGGGAVGAGGATATGTCASKTETCPPVSYETMAPAGIGYKLVVLDSEGTSKANLVLVGGPAVNTMTDGLVSVDDLCNPQTSVVRLMGNKLVVAGCEAADTMAAAESLVNWLKSKA